MPLNDEPQKQEAIRILDLKDQNDKTMMKVLVPVDFSEESINAFRFALDLTARSGGEIGLLYIVPLPVLRNSPRMPVERYRGPLIEELKSVAHFRFYQLIQEHNAETSRISADVLMSSHIHQTITDHASKNNFDTVVMGTKGASGIREWLIGSITEKVVRTCPVPVIAVKEYTTGIGIRDIVFPNILDIGTQGDLVARIKDLQRFFQAKLHIVRINTPTVFKSDAVIRQRLNEFARTHALVDYTINVFNYSTEEEGIREYARQFKGALIAMGTRGLRGVGRLISGSIAEDVVNHAQYPVWTYCTKAALQSQGI